MISRQNVARGLGIAAGIAATTGLVLLLTGDDEESTTLISAIPRDDGGLVTLSWGR
jgi:hypothetical protein